MSRPNVTFRLNDKSLVAPGSEAQSSKMTAGMMSTAGNAMAALSRAGETAAGVMYITNVQDLYARLVNMVTNFAGGGTFATGVTTYSMGSCAASYINGVYVGNALDGGTFPNNGGAFGGITFGGGRTAFREEYWALNNYLQYGAPVFVGFGDTTRTAPGACGFEAIADFTLFDVIFQGASSDIAFDAVRRVVEAKKKLDLPIFGILNVPSGTTPTDQMNTVPGQTFADYHYGLIYGEKVHLGANDGTDKQITTILAPDVAGCFARTDRDYFPWYSPAGTKRGRILNVIKLAKNLKAAEQDQLYDNGINPVVTFPGEGTFLFGDKTTKENTSTLSRMNVARLFINLKKTIGSIARETLFEVNNSVTRASFVAQSDRILRNVQNLNGISEYKIICDETNNPIDIVEANQFYAEILIKPLTSINFITITFTNVDLQSDINTQ